MEQCIWSVGTLGCMQAAPLFTSMNPVGLHQALVMGCIWEAPTSGAPVSAAQLLGVCAVFPITDTRLLAQCIGSVNQASYSLLHQLSCP